MRSLHLLCFALLCACTPSIDDDSVADDDATGDDDTSVGDDDSMGDDDTSVGDDDSMGDDDDDDDDDDDNVTLDDRSIVRDACGPADGPAGRIFISDTAVSACEEGAGAGYFIYLWRQWPPILDLDYPLNDTADGTGNLSRCLGWDAPCETLTGSVSFSAFADDEYAVGMLEVFEGDAIALVPFGAPFCPREDGPCG